jgi:hypothetical protein
MPQPAAPAQLRCRRGTFRQLRKPFSVRVESEPSCYRAGRMMDGNDMAAQKAQRSKAATKRN